MCCIVLENEILKLDIQKPGQEYRGTRFDWTGQITNITCKDQHTFCTTETADPGQNSNQGRGLYNEFGIKKPVGYDDCPVGGQFLKIGVGLLTRDSAGPYDFFHHYDHVPGEILYYTNEHSAVFRFKSALQDDYACQLDKEIHLSGTTFTIHYKLSNLGRLPIHTHEYVHNFLAIDNQPVGSQYTLTFPNSIDQNALTARVGPLHQVELHANTISFQDGLDQEYYFSNLQSRQRSNPGWCLVHKTANVGICETVDQPAENVCLWGKSHVISPEVFVSIDVAPGCYTEWNRYYEIYTPTESTVP